MVRLPNLAQHGKDPVRFVGVCADAAEAQREAIILTNSGYRCEVHDRTVAIGRSVRAKAHLLTVRGGP